MEISERLFLFRDMIRCCHELYFWTYDPELQLVQSNCPEELIISQFFVHSDYRETIRQYCLQHRRPGLHSGELGVMWLIEPQWQNGELFRIHILGPFATDNISTAVLEENMRQKKVPLPIQRSLMAFTKRLPVISLIRIFEYALMLHFCVTGEKILISDIHYRKTNQFQSGIRQKSDLPQKHGTYEAELEMLRFVREGDLNYKEHMTKMSQTGNLGKLSNNDEMRQMKNAVLVCITLFGRAAIDGGLSPEIALTLTDHYFQSVEACSSASELMEISHTLQDDFIQRVHRCRQNSSISKPISTCIDYINLHLEDDLTIEALANMLGYSDYYLSKKFKKETGKTIKEFIRTQRLERAKLLLKNSHYTILEVSDRLRFCAPSYFSDAFRKEYGISPTEFRENPQ